MNYSIPNTIRCCVLVGYVLLTIPHGAEAQNAETPPDRSWTGAAELTGVWTAGNAESSTFGLNATARRAWPMASLKLEGGGIRTETVNFTRRAVGVVGDFEVVEETDRQQTAESYYALARYDRKLGGDLFAFGGLDWLRNTFAGISSRTVASAGAGNLWIDSDQTRLKTDAGVTYTIQEDVVENPDISSNFAGLRAGLDLWKYISSTTEFTSVVVADLNLDNTEDVRVDWTSSLPVAISSRLALKPSLRLLWRNQPSLVELPLVRANGSSTGQVVTAPLQKTDLLFTLALVVKL